MGIIGNLRHVDLTSNSGTHQVLEAELFHSGFALQRMAPLVRFRYPRFVEPTQRYAMAAGVSSRGGMTPFVFHLRIYI